MYGWKKIKHLPWKDDGDLRWFTGNTFKGDKIDGNVSCGDINDNTNEWAITFNPIPVKYYLFTSKDSEYNNDFMDRYSIIETSILLTNLNNSVRPSYKELGYPNGNTQSIWYNRTGTTSDPQIGQSSRYMKKTGELYTSHTNIRHPKLYRD